MDRYAVAPIDKIGELDDGRAPTRAVRHHFGITSFGVNAWIAREAEARIINEHDESEPDLQEELYLVLSGRASFEIDGDQSTRRALTLRRPIEGASCVRAIRRTPTCSTTSAAAEASRARRIRPSRASDVRSNSPSGPARSLKETPTSIPSARTQGSRNCSPGDLSPVTRSAVF
jgi:hypothetical protein